MKRIVQFCLAAILAVFVFSCYEEEFTTNPDIKLEFSTDTISFDTVFTTIGSTTKYFKVKNPAGKAITISNIYLAGGESSPFRLSINGAKSNEDSNVELYGGDSLFVFVEVTIDPTGQNLPMVVHDSIVFNVNGNSQDVDLIAFGQDFHLFNGAVIKSQHWTNDKPYLIYNNAVVDSLGTLTIDPGCRVYFHNRSSLFVKGTLNVNGTYEEPVSFLGDRREEEYSNVPGQWGYYVEYENGSTYVFGGLHFLVGSRDNTIDYAIIRNANKGIQVDSLGASDNPVLTLTNIRIENMSLNCLDARTTFIKASNCIFANSGSYTVALRFGGDYEFNHCTVANYYTSNTRTDPALFFKNYYKYDKKTYSFEIEANFNNCIIYGNGNNEVSYDIVESSPFNTQFNTCLLNTYLNSNENNLVFTNSLLNEDPLFKDSYEYDFALDSLSPAINIGDVNIANLYPLDLNKNSRLSDKGPDLGALEWIPVTSDK